MKLVDLTQDNAPKKMAFVVGDREYEKSAAVQKYLFENFGAFWGGCDQKVRDYSGVICAELKPGYGWRLTYTSVDSFWREIGKEYQEISFDIEMVVKNAQFEHDTVTYEGKEYRRKDFEKAISQLNPV